MSIACTLTRGAQALAAAPPGTSLLVLSPATIVAPAAIAALLDGARLAPGEAALAVDFRPEARHRLLDVRDGLIRSFLTEGNAASTGLALFTREAIQIAWRAASVEPRCGGSRGPRGCTR